MKILQLCNKAPFPANDGSSIAIYNMAVGLLNNGVEVHLLTINTKKHFKSDDNIPTDFFKNVHYQSVFKDTNPTFFGMMINFFSSKSYFDTRFYFREFEQKLKENLQAFSYDIIQLEGFFMCSYIPIIRQYSSAKIVLRAHNIEHIIWERHIKTLSNPIKKAYLSLQTKRLRKQELKAFNQVDYIIPITAIDQKEMEKWVDSSRLHTALTGVNLTEYQLKTDPLFEPFSVFCFGSMDWMPNQVAVEWFLEHCCGLRIKIVEGLSFGKAIVTTPVGCEGINVQSNRDLLIAETPKDFVDSVLKLLEDSLLRESMEANAKSFAKEELDNTKLTATLVQFYNSILS